MHIQIVCWPHVNITVFVCLFRSCRTTVKVCWMFFHMEKWVINSSTRSPSWQLCSTEPKISSSSPACKKTIIRKDGWGFTHQFHSSTVGHISYLVNIKMRDTNKREGGTHIGNQAKTFFYSCLKFFLFSGFNFWLRYRAATCTKTLMQQEEGENLPKLLSCRNVEAALMKWANKTTKI